MAVSAEQIRAVMTGSPKQRVESLQMLLGYPVLERDPEQDLFWYLRPGADAGVAGETQPVAVGFSELLNHASDAEIKATLTSQMHEHHAAVQDVLNYPAMYLLLPEQPQAGRVAMVLPVEGRFRQRQVATFRWDEPELRNRLRRLQSSELPEAEQKALLAIPPVERAFYEPAKTASGLAQELAKVARLMEQAIPAVYRAEGDGGYLHKLLLSFQRELLPSLKLESDSEKDYSFADIYAQTIAYGLFTARVFSYAIDQREERVGQTNFTRREAWQLLPETNPFLRQLFRDVSEQEPEELGEELLEAISEVFAILRAAEMHTILDDFRARMNREDIVIRFYEDFLAAYKPQMRERRGVYYTPEPVVSYMVRSVDILLKEKFNKPLGLADPEVMILDPACGTGTFLLWIFQLIHKRFEENPKALTEGLADKSWSGYVRERLLPRVFGFELLMAPYAIAHLKLGLFLEETGYKFNMGQRLGIYLTNTLEAAESQSETLFEEFISHESNQANLIKKEKEVMVVIGNPPYSSNSQNLSENSKKWIDPYRFFDNKPIKEKGALQFEKNIQDDYIKFFSFAQSRIDRIGYGISAFITNNSYLDGPTLRGMRQSISKSFDSISILDLHGNSKRKEVCPDGSKDENVFDIQQGVSISFLVKSIMPEVPVYNHCSLWGLRNCRNGKGKYDWLSNKTSKSTPWIKFKPWPSFFLFKPQDNALLSEYEKGEKITEIMPINSTGIITARDALTIQFTKHDLWETVSDFSELPVEMARNKFKLGKDTNDWKISLAQKDITLKCSSSKEYIKQISYRPFDFRYTYYTGNARGFHCNPRRPVMRNLVNSENIAFHMCRQLSTSSWAHVHATNLITDDSYVSNKTRERGYTFPLYIYPEKDTPLELQEAKRSNFNSFFLDRLSSNLKCNVPSEIIFYYIYAILHSPTYRNRYLEFLKIDFPRIPFTKNLNLFHQLSNYGNELFLIHLMKSSKLKNIATQFKKDSNFVVAPGYPKYVANKVHINKEGDVFSNVPEEVWNFQIGGYQVCHKWLKDRKGRTLSDDDILHYQRIVVALKETIKLMQKIDDAIPSWPIE